ncbi:hypothetical protein C8F01DRAFT_427031 [Mycena amicta]|nr:hypothetical protein C8F01DRAFT_427031 [Mycena amicta]
MRNFGTMSERQRALSVKRARKMTQVFGQEPPAELIQVQDDREEEDPSRDSMAFSALFASTPTLRDRAGSVSSLGDASADELPATPPPFSTSFARGEEGETRDTNNFQDRRRRAAKLSRFFGVDVTAGLPDAMPALPTAKMQVDVKVSGRRFWGFNDRPKDSDMQEAMKKLREMKAG